MMVSENIKAQEIKRLTTPLTFKKDKAYDCEGNIISCVETISEVKFIVEPRPGILSDEEILQYAPQSKAASKIRLRMGSGDTNDILLSHQSMPWILGLYYVILISIAIAFAHTGNKIYIYVVLLFVVLPLLYLYYVFNLKSYVKKEKPKRVRTPKKEKVRNVEKPKDETIAVESLQKYNVEANHLKDVYGEKEIIVKDLIEKRFEPPQITYDRFMSSIGSCHKLFYTQYDSLSNITKLAVDDTPRIKNELDSKINAMKKIIKQIEDLINELVITSDSSEKSKDEVKVLIEDMENLIESVKEY
ncbi:MAG: hypothetical protein IKE95_09285 [Methanobrevibacter sp.]|nr:hypothetical protein [Methanobrevibacter sp.]